MPNKLLSYFSRALAQHKKGPLAVSWKGIQSQQLGFRELLWLGDFSNSSVLDVGCGLGDLFTFLDERFSQIDYTGIDINPDMIASARKLAGVEFSVHDMTDQPMDRAFDWVVASGVFNLSERSYPEQLALVRRGLKNMFHSARRGVACNFLSAEACHDAVYRREGELRFHYESVRALTEFCLSFLTPHFAVRHCTLDAGAFTLFLYRDVDPAHQEVLSELPEAVDLPSSRRRLYTLARLGRFDELEEWISSLKPGPERAYLRGLYLCQIGMLEEAERSMAHSTHLSSDVREDRASLLLMLGRYREMVALLEPHIETSGEVALERYCDACLMLGNVGKAGRAAELLPLGPLRSMLLGKIAALSGDLERAKRYLLEAHRDAPYSSVICEHLFRLHLKAGDAVTALEWIEKAIHNDPASDDLRGESAALARALQG